MPAFTGLAKKFWDGGKQMGYPQVDLNAVYSEGSKKIYWLIQQLFINTLI